ncbi:MAG: MFS transporter [Polyangiales bacterium]
MAHSGASPLGSEFRLYAIARVFVTLASTMQMVAIGWQVYELTGRTLELGLVGLATFVPGAVVTLFAGTVADRVERRTLLRSCYVAMACVSATLLALAVSGPLRSTAPIFLVLPLVGATKAFAGPAGQALLPSLVPAESFPRAVALMSSLFQGGLIAGPALGGFVYGTLGGAPSVYVLSLACLVVSIVATGLLRTRSVAPPREVRMADEVLAGLRYVGANRILFAAITLDLFAVLLGGATAILPAFAHEVLHAGAETAGLLRAAPGVGAVAMGFYLGRRPLGRHAGRTMLVAVAIFGLSMLGFALSRDRLAALLFLVLGGAADMVSVVVRHSLVQLRTPDEKRGRVTAVHQIAIGASNELGELESGLAAEAFGLVPSLVVGGLGTLVVVALYALRFPELRLVDAPSGDRG